MFISAWHPAACGEEAGAELSRGERNHFCFPPFPRMTNDYPSSQQFPTIHLRGSLRVFVHLIIESSDKGWGGVGGTFINQHLNVTIEMKITHVVLRKQTSQM